MLLTASDKTGGALGGFGKSLASFLENPAKAAGAGLLVLGTLAVGAGIKATQMAADYDQQMRSVQNNTHSSDAAMRQYDAGLKTLAMDAGVGPQKLTLGLQSVVSAGFAGKDALDVLTLSTRDAVIGLTDADTTGKALTKMLYGFSVPAKDFNAVNGEMLRTVSLGSMTMGDYAGAISKSIPVAIQYKDSMESMNAVIATISPVTKSAAVASTGYNNLLKVLDGSVDSVAKKAHSLNSSFNETAFKAMNVHDKVGYLNQMIVQHGHNISDVIGKQQNAAQAFTILATHASAYTNNLKQLSDKQANAKASQEQWNITQGGFNQTMNRLHATLDVVMISIGQKLLPVVTKFAQQLVPIVTQVGDWMIKSGALDTVAKVLGTTLGLVVDAIVNIFTKGAQFIDWLNKGSVGATAVKVVLVALLGAALGFVAAGIPALVTGFIAWATAAGAAAIATIAAAAPFILVGIAIALVVAGIILAVQHWGDITKWIGGVWHSMVQGVIDMMASLGIHIGKTTAELQHEQAVKHDEMKLKAINSTQETAEKSIAHYEKMRQGILKELSQTKDPAQRAHLEMKLKAVDAAIKQKEGVIQHAQAQKIAVLKHLKEMHDREIEDNKTNWSRWMEWCGKLVGDVGHWFQQMGSDVGKWVAAMWKDCTTWVSRIYNDVIKWFEDLWTGTVQKVTSMYNGVVQWFTILKTNAVQKVTDLINTVLGWWDTLKTSTNTKITDVVNMITTFFTSLPAKAVQWGQNLIQGFINGIQNMAGSVGSAIGGITKTIGSFLPHSPAQQGELQHLNEYGPNLVKGFAQGITSSLPVISSAADQMTSKLAAMNDSSQYNLTGNSRINTQYLASSATGSVTGTGGIGASTSGNGAIIYRNTYTITINAARASAKDVAKEVIDCMSKDLRCSGNMVSIQSGGRT